MGSLHFLGSLNMIKRCNVNSEEKRERNDFFWRVQVDVEFEAQASPWMAVLGKVDGFLIPRLVNVYLFRVVLVID